MPELPSGTVTFLFTDIEGSTRLWERDPVAMRTTVARHDAMLSEAVAARGGVLFKHVGDAIQAAFADPIAAVAAVFDVLTQGGDGPGVFAVDPASLMAV